MENKYENADLDKIEDDVAWVRHQAMLQYLDRYPSETSSNYLLSRQMVAMEKAEARTSIQNLLENLILNDIKIKESQRCLQLLNAFYK